MKDRAAHMQWCKDRALDLVSDGDVAGALASMTSDLGKHDDTRDLVPFCLTAGMLNSQNAESMRLFIEGFA